MTRLLRKVMLVAAALSMSAAVSRAALPSAAKSTCPGLIRLVGSLAGQPDAADGRFVVIVHDADDNAIDGCRVTVSFCEATDLRVAQNQLNPAYVVDCQAGTVSALTDPDGTVRFTILGGSLTLPHGTSTRGSVKIFADDPATSEVESILLSDASPTTGLSCSAPDEDGIGGLGASDFVELLKDTSQPPSSGCWQRSDFNGDGVVQGFTGQPDHDVLLGLLGLHRMPASGVPYCTPCAPPAPTLVSVQPNTCGQIAPITVTVNGTNFENGATAALELVNQPPVTGTVTWLNSTTLQVTFDLSQRPTGAWDVRVTNPGGGTAVLTGGFTITEALQAVTPTISENIGTIELTVTGCGFLPGATIKLSRSGETDIVGTSTNVVATDEANAMFDVDGRAIGKWDVTVTNPDGSSSTLVEGFELQPPQPGDLVLAVIGDNSLVKPNKNPRVRLEVSQTGNADWKGFAFLALTVSGNVGAARLRMLNCCSTSSTDLFLYPDGTDQITSLVMLPSVPVSPAIGYELELRRPLSTQWTVGSEVKVCARLYSAREDRYDLGAILRDDIRVLGDRLASGTEPSLGSAFETAFHAELGTALADAVAAFSQNYSDDLGNAVLQNVHNSGFVLTCVENALDALAANGFATDVNTYRTGFWDAVHDVYSLDPDCSDITDPRCFESGQEADYLALASPPKPTITGPTPPPRAGRFRW